MDQAIETVTLFVLIATIVACARENVMGVLNSPGKEDDWALGISIFICITFNITLIGDIAASELAESTSKFQGFLDAVRPWVDNVVSGSALAGGGAALVRRLKKAKSEVQAA